MGIIQEYVPRDRPSAARPTESGVIDFEFDSSGPHQERGEVLSVPDVSVIMATRNASATIEDAIHSLESQVFAGTYEIVVVDDCSSDETVVKIERLASALVRIVSLPKNVGRAKARNIGIAQSSGSVLVIADSDDISLPHRLAFHWEMLRLPGSNVSGGQLFDIIDGHAEANSTLRFPESSTAVDHAFSRGRMGIAHPASSFKRSWFDRVGGYDDNLSWCEDYDLFARGWIAGSYRASSEVVLGYRRHGRRVSWTYWWENQRHHAAINRRLALTGRGSAASGSNFEQFLDQESRTSRKAFEWVRYLAYQIRLTSAK
jgi:glycosyltransferase involved in cell wall biosynthesis